MLEFHTEIEGVKINGVDIISWNDDGRITHFKVMLRPLKAINMVHQKMGLGGQKCQHGVHHRPRCNVLTVAA